MKHYHLLVDARNHRICQDQHPGGHLRHQHPARNLWGYGRTRKSLKALQVGGQTD